AGAAVHGDGKISVANGDAIEVRYVDASSCGTPNVPVVKSASVDCVLPAITNLQAAPGANSAAVSWNTSEAANGIIHYGTTVPTGATLAAAGTTSHGATITGLASC